MLLLVSHKVSSEYALLNRNWIFVSFRSRGGLSLERPLEIRLMLLSNRAPYHVSNSIYIELSTFIRTRFKSIAIYKSISIGFNLQKRSIKRGAKFVFCWNPLLK